MNGDPLNPTGYLDKVVDAIQRVGFPIVMCLILLWIIYSQNKTIDNLQNQLDSRDTADITKMIQDTCGK